jgi:hypothetical protein
LQILVSSDIYGSNKQQIWYILHPSNSYLFHKVFSLCVVRPC